MVQANPLLNDLNLCTKLRLRYKNTYFQNLIENKNLLFDNLEVIKRSSIFYFNNAELPDVDNNIYRNEQIKQKIEALKQRSELLNGHMTTAAEEPVALSSAVLKINRLQTNAAVQFGICAILYIIQYGANLLIFHSSQSSIFLLAIYAFACIDTALFSITIRDLLYKWRMPKEASVRTLFVFASYVISAVIFLGITHLLIGGLIR